MAMSKIGEAEFSVTTFFASCHPNDKCGANGLPLTPNSIKILGKFQYLVTLGHPSLCKYIHISRGKQERLIVVAEHYRTNLAQRIKDENPMSEEDCLKMAFDILEGLDYLSKKNIVVKNLSPDTVLFDNEGNVKISRYGMNYMTEEGQSVAYPLGVARYMAPEVVCAGPVVVDEYSNAVVQPNLGPKVDVWSLGLILLEALAGRPLWATLTLQQTISKVLSFASSSYDTLDVILKENKMEEVTERLEPAIVDLLRKCLTVSPTSRSSSSELLGHEAFASVVPRLATLPPSPYAIDGVRFFSSKIDLNNLELPTEEEARNDGDEARKKPNSRRKAKPPNNKGNNSSSSGSSNNSYNSNSNSYSNNTTTTTTTGYGSGGINEHNSSNHHHHHNNNNNHHNSHHLCQRSMDEVYYLWRLAGGDLESVLKRAGLIKSRPPVTLLPSFILNTGEWFGQRRDQSELLDNTMVVLSLDQLRNRLKDVGDAFYYPLLEDDDTADAQRGLPTSPSSGDLSQAARLPLIIREKDVEYQFHRVILYERLLLGYPYKKAHIWREARVDTPPLYRAQVWAALLEVDGDIQARYDSIDKETATPTDRQIEVDIPRCHQYHELLSSPEAHKKFKRILKAWIVSHPEYVYWQGLDSLCAPFLALNFNREALAFACLDAFIPKYLNKFFLKDNSLVIQEYLAVFSHLIAYHDPELSNHLETIGFIPDLYAIPWFLTMYAHVFPLHKIVHLWDTLLLGNSSFPLCIGVAILHQLRDRLLAYGFNDCILLFSDMPEVDIEKCVQDSIKIFCSTPKSATYRQHALPTASSSAAASAAARRHGISASSSSASSSSSSSHHGRSAAAAASGNASMTSSAGAATNCSTGLHHHHDLSKSKDQLPIEELKREKCPRISAEDLIDLGDLKISPSSASSRPLPTPTTTTTPRSPTATTGPSTPTPAPVPSAGKPKLLMIDIRSSEDYKRGTVPGSYSVPFQTAFNVDGTLASTQFAQTLTSHRLQVKVVIGGMARTMSEFADSLVRLGCPRVCTLHRGIDVLKPTGLLTVPPADI